MQYSGSQLEGLEPRILAGVNYFEFVFFLVLFCSVIGDLSRSRSLLWRLVFWLWRGVFWNWGAFYVDDVLKTLSG